MGQRSDLLTASLSNSVSIFSLTENASMANSSKSFTFTFTYSLRFPSRLHWTETQQKRSPPLERLCGSKVGEADRLNLGFLWTHEACLTLPHTNPIPWWQRRKLAASLCHTIIDAEVNASTAKWLLTASLVIKDEREVKCQAPVKNHYTPILSSCPGFIAWEGRSHNVLWFETIREYVFEPGTLLVKVCELSFYFSCSQFQGNFLTVTGFILFTVIAMCVIFQKHAILCCFIHFIQF